MGKNVFQIGRLYVVMSMDYDPVAEGGILRQSFTISKGSDKKAQSSAGQSMKEDQTIPP